MITFVTSLLYLNYHDKQKIDTNVSLFLNFFKNLNIVLFVSNEYIHYFNNDFENIKIIPFDIKNSWVYKEPHENVILPSFRNHEKDTCEFLLNAYVKYELIEMAIQENYFSSLHFAWIDFTTMNLFKNIEPTVGFLKMLNNHSLNNHFIAIPGCWNKFNKDSSFDIISNSVYWRFCGGYFLGDKQSILLFCNTVKTHFSLFLKNNNIITWDFNLWAWLEVNVFQGNEKGDSPEKTLDKLNLSWYSADHNESLIFCSADNYTHPLIIHEKIEYNYPLIDELQPRGSSQSSIYYPTSASYIYYNHTHWLNTRYVNYWIQPNGNYLFPNDDKIIQNKNVLSILDDNYCPITFKLVDEHINIPIYPQSISQGLEDVRLYCENNNVQKTITEEHFSGIKYIATTIGFSSDGKSKMIYGDYDLNAGSILNGQIIDSPNFETNSYQKNWIPIDNKFIYKWNPLQIGVINSNNWKIDGHSKNDMNNLRNEMEEDYQEPNENDSSDTTVIPSESLNSLQMDIIAKYNIHNMIFNKMRGSTCFNETNDGWVGVIHFSEEHQPRHYYHMLVMLDKTTLEIIKYTDTFCFEKLGVEFCLGFTIHSRENMYIFWISRHDRDPVMIKVKIDDMIWKHTL